MITQEELKKHLEYREDGHLYWISSEHTNNSISIKVGQRAGSITKYSHGYYVRIRILGKRYMEHRLIWLYHYGEFPNSIIDHEDGDGLNNKIDNLRLASDSQNQYNTKIRSNNKSGYKGVYFVKDGGYERWVASITIDGKQIRIGHYHNKEDAAMAYNTYADKHFGEFARLNIIKNGN